MIRFTAYDTLQIYHKHITSTAEDLRTQGLEDTVYNDIQEQKAAIEEGMHPVLGRMVAFCKKALDTNDIDQRDGCVQGSGERWSIHRVLKKRF